MGQLYTYSQIFSSHESLLDGYDNGWWLQNIDTRFIGEWQSVARTVYNSRFVPLCVCQANLQPDNRIGDANMGEKVAALLGCDFVQP